MVQNVNVENKSPFLSFSASYFSILEPIAIAYVPFQYYFMCL